MPQMVFITSQLGIGISNYGFRAHGKPNRRSTRPSDRQNSSLLTLTQLRLPVGPWQSSNEREIVGQQYQSKIEE